MAIGYGTVAPKGPTRKLLKGRKDRTEAKVAKAVRAECVERDGYCRLRKDSDYTILGIPNMTLCDGPSEWAHLEDTRRARTRKMAPELRHHTAGTMQLCRAHHDQYDGRAKPRLRIKFLTNRGADGAVEFTRGR